MADLGVTVISSGAFLDEAFAQAADATLRAVLRTVEDLRNPPYSVADRLKVLHDQGARKLALGISTRLAIDL